MPQINQRSSDLGVIGQLMEFLATPDGQKAMEYVGMSPLLGMLMPKSGTLRPAIKYLQSYKKVPRGDAAFLNRSGVSYNLPVNAEQRSIAPYGTHAGMTYGLGDKLSLDNPHDLFDILLKKGWVRKASEGSYETGPVNDQVAKTIRRDLLRDQFRRSDTVYLDTESGNYDTKYQLLNDLLFELSKSKMK